MQNIIFWAFICLIFFQNASTTFPYFCTNEDRLNNCDNQENLVVCGWFYFARNKCMDYPCARTFNNTCLACVNKFVEKLTEGVCPTRPSYRLPI